MLKTTATLLAKNVNEPGKMVKVGTIVEGDRGFEFILLDCTFDYASLPRPEGKNTVQLTLVYSDREFAKEIANGN